MRPLLLLLVLPHTVVAATPAPPASPAKCSASSDAFLTFQTGQRVELDASAPIIVTHAGVVQVQCLTVETGQGRRTCRSFVDQGKAAGEILTERTDLVAGVPFEVLWTTSNEPELCVASSSPSIAGWSGAVSITGGARALTILSEGRYELGIQCWNDGGGAGKSILAIDVEA